MENLIINTETLNSDTAILNMRGFIDSTNASTLKKTIETFISKNYYNLIVNFEHINYVSSAGWGVLIGKIRKIREHKGDIILVGMDKSVFSIYELMELNQIFKYKTSVQEALSSLGKQMLKIKETVIAKKTNEEKPILPQKQIIEQQKKVQEKLERLKEEIRFIISETPLIGINALISELSKEQHGGWKINRWQLKRLLKTMGLGTITKRLYYAFRKARGEI